MQGRSRDPDYGCTAHLRGTTFEEARARTVEALKSQSFGVLTEIDVQDCSLRACEREPRPRLHRERIRREGMRRTA